MNTVIRFFIMATYNRFLNKNPGGAGSRGGEWFRVRDFGVEGLGFPFWGSLEFKGLGVKVKGKRYRGKGV